MRKKEGGANEERIKKKSKYKPKDYHSFLVEKSIETTGTETKRVKCTMGKTMVIKWESKNKSDWGQNLKNKKKDLEQYAKGFSEIVVESNKTSYKKENKKEWRIRNSETPKQSTNSDITNRWMARQKEGFRKKFSELNRFKVTYEIDYTTIIYNVSYQFIPAQSKTQCVVLDSVKFNLKKNNY